MYVNEQDDAFVPIWEAAGPGTAANRLCGHQSPPVGPSFPGHRAQRQAGAIRACS